MSNEKLSIPIAIRLIDDQIISISKSGQSKTDYIREAIDEKIAREDKDFINKKIRQLKDELEKLEGFKKLINEKEEHKARIPEKELNWLLETKRILEQQPAFTEGRLKLYINTFPKSYKINKQDFFNLLHEAENQLEEKKVLKQLNQIELQGGKA